MQDNFPEEKKPLRNLLSYFFARLTFKENDS